MVADIDITILGERPMPWPAGYVIDIGPSICCFELANNMIRRYLGASGEISILILTSSLW